MCCGGVEGAEPNKGSLQDKGRGITLLKAYDHRKPHEGKSAAVKNTSVSSSGQSQMVGPSKTILAMIDDDIMLPCHLEPATDVVARTLEWARLDLNPRFVHVRRDGVELLVNQNPSYMGRTSVSTDRLKHGDISLKLSKVKVSDEGKYRCHIPALGTSAVDLVVGALSSPVVIIAEIDKPIRRVVLQCESKGWYPEPEVLWLDGEGNLLSAGPPETVRGPDDLYTVSSRVTVEKRHSNSFTCRVQQKNINQTRETEIRILVTLPRCAALAQRDNKVHRDNVTKTLQEKEEEHKDMLHVVSVLKEHKKELEISEGKQILQLEKVVEEMRENDKKLKKIDRKYSWDKDSNKSTLLPASFAVTL
ncbi:butyrophilin subfamily 3 member A2-like [Sebastes umbrosus]|uniref:butyrophilin subfamily 3 member A2-like n=1 Tax=Sebastes umbrosus TaxID=72105 RepID=UPI00189DC9D2|nr:butyrophilin subfamily 3 member A2-like [Sebastes umbrosus]